MEGTEIRIVNDVGVDVPIGAIGEIVTRGPELFIGYLDTSMNDAAFLPDGWYRTGDIGRLDAEGFLVITDRKKDIIIRGGENIASRDVEEIMQRHPAVAAVAAVAAPDARLGEIVKIYVELRPSSDLTLDEVRAHFLRDGVARQRTPERLEIVAELPRNAAGKILKAELRKRAQATTAE